MSLTAPTPAGAPAVLRSGAPHPGRLLAVVLDRDDLEITVPAALGAAVDDQAELHVAILQPRPAWTTDPALLARLVDRSERAAESLAAAVRSAAAAAGVPTTVSVHLLAGLDGRRRQRVLERVVARLACRFGARPVGGWAA